MHRFTPREILAIEIFLDETDTAEIGGNEHIKNFKQYQRNIVDICKKYAKEVREIEDN